MTSDEYDRKINLLLNDKKTYKEIKRDPTNTFKKQNNELVKRWENQLYISPATSKNLQIRNALSPKMYGLPKLHKEGIPLRPIVSCIQSPFAQLSKFLKNILNNILYKNNHYIKDSFQFKDKLNNIKIPDNYVLISLDVISLYTNIPVKLVTKLIEKNWKDIKKYTDLPMTEIVGAIELTLNSTYFLQGNNLFKQIDGCAMGSSMSSAVAQLVMEDLEITTLAKLKFQIPFFYRFVDDCIMAVPADQVNNVVNEFNKYHKKLQFTVETEINKQINFLDLTLFQTNNTIKTKWYTKSRYLNYNLHHPTCQKKSVIIGLADRAIKLSDIEYRQEAIEKAKNALSLNEYPIALINKIFKQRINKFYNSLQSPNKAKGNHINYISLPYVNGLSQPLKKLYSKHNINICHKAHNLLSENYSKLKTQVPKNKKSKVVYEMKCKVCEGIYIGQTSQLLENRIKSHKYDKKM